jgi:predicted RNA-binding protein with PIN domain
VDVSEDISASLAASIGAYIRATAAQELPGPLRRFKGWRPKALGRHRGELLAVLEDDVERKRILKWLDDGKAPLDDADAELLRIASARHEGWVRELAGRSREAVDDCERRDLAPDLVAALERERAKHRAAREELRRSRRSTRAVADAEKRRAEDVARELASLRQELDAAREMVARLRSDAAVGAEAFDRERRRLTRAVERTRAERDELKQQLKKARREHRALEGRNAELERPTAARSGSPPAGATSDRFPPPARRRPLPVPRGLFDDSPETLLAWLDAPSATLLVDGYNVAKSDQGYGVLDLPAQRGRLVDDVDRLTRRHGVRAIIVFDGATIAPGLSRRRRAGASVVYSRPPESADDHLVGLVEELPSHPVVLVTSDRELRARAADLGATLAHSAQLLALIR